MELCNCSHRKGVEDHLQMSRRKGKQVDHSCRNHGSCPWCRGKRERKYRRQIVEEEEREFKIKYRKVPKSMVQGR